MENNLIPPFVMREAGIDVNDVPKIQVEDPSVEDHSIFFSDTGFRIPLSLWGTFSYFYTSKPSVEFLSSCEDVYLLTPTNFNPHCDAYERNEENMLDWEGNIVEKQHRTQILLSEVNEDMAMAASVQISSVESAMIDRVINTSAVSEEETLKPEFGSIPKAADEVSSMLADVSPIYHDLSLYKGLSERVELGKFKASIGSTDAPMRKYLVDNETASTAPSSVGSGDDESELEI